MNISTLDTIPAYPPLVRRRFGLIHRMREILFGEASGNPQPLSAVVLGTKENVDDIACALCESCELKTAMGWPLRVVATHSGGILTICDGLCASPAGPRSARQINSFVESSLAIAQQMSSDSQSQALHADMLWLKAFADHCSIDHAIVAIPAQFDRETEDLLIEAARIFKHVLIIPCISDEKVIAESYGSKSNWGALQIGELAAYREPGLAKRVFNLAGAVLLALITLPLFLFIALLIYIISRRPIFEREWRIAKGNRVFLSLRFRTKQAGSSRLELFLRRIKLDTLPQIWNVLLGDMSLLGPRPIGLADITQCAASYTARQKVRGGFTGRWQTSRADACE